MKYLSFDIECCDGYHICEFGYVITDDTFNVTEKECLTINPQKPFNLIGRAHRADCILFFPQETYYNSPTFPDFYDRINKLISMRDTIIIGHSMKSDAMFLRDACKRYKLPPLDFNFIDSQLLYTEYSGDKESISLEKAETIFNLDKPKCHHKSDEDALLTIKLVKEICQRLNVSVSDLIRRYPNACGESRKFNVQYSGDNLKSMIDLLASDTNNLSVRQKKICIQKFADAVQPQGQIITSCLNDKKLCFSLSYEKKHTAETVKLIQMLANHGCKYNTKVSENDYYVASVEESENPYSEEKTRYRAALKNDDGKEVKILSFDEFLSMVGLTAETISQLKMPVVPEQSKIVKRAFSTGIVTNTIGDQLRAKGIDISKIFSE